MRKCEYCEGKFDSSINGHDCCKKHYLQIKRHGHILEHTIYDKNNWIEEDSYLSCITYDRYGNENGKLLIDKEDLDLVTSYKWHIRNSNGKLYGIATIPNGTKSSNKKIHLHKLILNTNNKVDHINGNGLDNRKSNLRLCTSQENSFNIKKISIPGIKKMNYAKESWQASITYNYKTIYIGTYNTYEEAILARLAKEKELFGEFGGRSNLYYILNHLSPIEELKRVLSDKA